MAIKSLVYVPADGYIECTTEGSPSCKEFINCGEELPPIVVLLYRLKIGEISLQKAYDDYLYMKEAGVL